MLFEIIAFAFSATCFGAAELVKAGQQPSRRLSYEDPPPRPRLPDGTAQYPHTVVWNPPPRRRLYDELGEDEYGSLSRRRRMWDVNHEEEYLRCEKQPSRPKQPASVAVRPPVPVLAPAPVPKKDYDDRDCRRRLVVHEWCAEKWMFEEAAKMNVKLLYSLVPIPTDPIVYFPFPVLGTPPTLTRSEFLKLEKLCSVWSHQAMLLYEMMSRNATPEEIREALYLTLTRASQWAGTTRKKHGTVVTAIHGQPNYGDHIDASNGQFAMVYAPQAPADGCEPSPVYRVPKEKVYPLYNMITGGKTSEEIIAELGLTPA